MHACFRFSHVQLFVTLWTMACQAPLSMGFSRQEYCSGLLWPPLGDLPDPGVKPKSLMFPALADRLFTSGATWEAPVSGIQQGNSVYTSMHIHIYSFFPL